MKLSRDNKLDVRCVRLACEPDNVNAGRQVPAIHIDRIGPMCRCTASKQLFNFNTR